MHEIHPNLLWIGNARDARDARLLFDAGIEAVVDLAIEETPAQLPRQIVYCRFPLNDGSGNNDLILRQALQCTVDLLSLRLRTLVACGAGMSRSPTIAAFALAAILNEEPEKVLSGIAVHRPLDVRGSFWADAAKQFVHVRSSSR